MLKTAFILTIVSIILLKPAYLFAAAGCTLNNPDKDIKLIFPEPTGYKTKAVIGEKLEIEKRLGVKLDPAAKASDVPYTFYTVLKGEKVVGYIHGVNQEGMHGEMQVFLAIDPDGKIINLFYQKLSSPDAAKFKEKTFTNQFKDMTLADFYHHDDMKGYSCPSDLVAKIKSPGIQCKEDFEATLRGVKLNLILFDKFLLNDKYEKARKQTD